MSGRKKFKDVKTYMETLPAEARASMEEIRAMIKRLVPEAKELISYQIPAFKLTRVFIYFAAFKNHISIFPPIKDDAELIEELQEYRNDRGNLRFPLDQPMPYELIGRVICKLAEQ